MSNDRFCYLYRALEAETASRHEELAAAQQKFAAESEDTRASLKELRELLDAREGHLALREAELKQQIGRAHV